MKALYTMTTFTPLTFTHLRFQARACTPIRLGQYQAGEILRDALARVMLRAICPETRRTEKPTPEHAAVCPACWLLAAETNTGAVSRVYSLAGPQPPLDILAPNQPFQFTITLFGDGFRFLPYFVLAASAMGDTGVGPGRGTFEIVSIRAVNPLADESHTILEEGEKVVKPQALPVLWEHAQATARGCSTEGEIRVRFLSPTRLIDSDHILKAPDFGIFFRRLLKRIDDLNGQHNGGTRRPPEEVAELHQLADQVRLVEQSTQMIDLWGPSVHHPGRPTPMGGFVGYAVYPSRHWDRLLPWLLLGQGVQVGRLTAKGNGVFQVDLRGRKGYWV